MNGPRARKRLGQHFLHDPAIISKIVTAVNPQIDETVVEIGGGRGALTGPLLERAGKLDVIEVDPRLAASLGDLPGKLNVHQADALKFDFTTLAIDGRRLRIVGNLPYNISTPILFHLLASRHAIDDMHLMLQKEVVTRMVAKPGGKDFGRLTVMLSPWLDIAALFDIGPGAFNPPPKVWSTVVRARVRTEIRFPIADEARFSRLVAKLFSMRRKTLGRILKGDLLAADIESIGIDPRARPETLDPADFARLAAICG